mgnify:CR=1 FL=1
MNYSKAMIDLISEARRRAPSDDKPNIKLANPDVLTELNKIYHHSTDTVLRVIIKETFLLAGDRWLEKLDEPIVEEETDHGPRFITKVYRGQTQLIEIAPEGSDTLKEKSVRMYRGHAVA